MSGDAGPKTIAVLRALQLGDSLCAVPALRALRRRWPAARVTLIGLPWARELVTRFPDYLDDFMELPGFPGVPECGYEPRAAVQFVREAQQRRFDLALQLQGPGEASNALVALLGARRMAGYFREGQFCPDATSFLSWREDEHETERGVRLLAVLGAPCRRRGARGSRAARGPRRAGGRRERARPSSRRLCLCARGRAIAVAPLVSGTLRFGRRRACRARLAHRAHRHRQRGDARARSHAPHACHRRRPRGQDDTRRADGVARRRAAARDQRHRSQVHRGRARHAVRRDRVRRERAQLGCRRTGGAAGACRGGMPAVHVRTLPRRPRVRAWRRESRGARGRGGVAGREAEGVAQPSCAA